MVNYSSERPKRTGIMLCYPFEEKRLAKWQAPYIIQPKLDGERCRLIIRNGICLMLSSTEEIITSVPHIAQLAAKTMPDGEFDGELYVHGWPFEEIHSVVSRRVNLHSDYEQMQFHCFDHVSGHPQVQRCLDLLNLSCWNNTIQLVQNVMANSLDDVMATLENFMMLNYEGIIIRHHSIPYERKRSTGVMKFKPAKMDAYEITGSFEEVSKNGLPKNSLGGFICRGDDGTEFRVGSGFTQKQRIDYWQRRDSFLGMFLNVKYQHLTPGRGCPRFPIFCSIIGRETANDIENKD